MNLDAIQKDFLLNAFFKPFDENKFAGWKNIAEKLLETGKCVVPHKNPWEGGIGNFIETKEAEEFVDCVELNFDLGGFISSDNLYFKEVYNQYLAELSNKKRDIDAQVESIQEL